MGGKKRNKPVLPGACIFCRSDSDNEIMFGKFIHKDDISVHEKCLFFSSGLKQTKSEDMDIFGFAVKDIRKELLRGQKLRCVFCKSNRATVGCSKHECRKSFHYPCGMKNYALFQHYDSFRAFCKNHKPRQKKIVAPADEFICRICFSSLQNEDSNTYLYTKCCKNNWFHRNCLQEYAFSAGSYFFKCPMCNDSGSFSKEMQFQGIHVPIKDASWELEDNAYQDLLFRPGCDPSICKCEMGTKFPGLGLWKLLPCNLCGAQARHKICANLKAEVMSWTCNDCTSLDSANQTPDETTSKIEDRGCSVALEESPSPVKIEASLYPSSSSLRPITNILGRSNTSTFLNQIFPKESTAGSEVKSGSKGSGVRELKREVVHSYPIRSRSNAQPQKTNPTQPIKKRSCARMRVNGGIYKNNGNCCSPNSPFRCIRVMFGLECRRI